MVRVQVEAESIAASGGHRFWLAGEGWVRARDLTNAQRFHGLAGPVAVEAVEVGDSQATYNLIVADFHTYFVGDAKILSHDNTTVQPTEALVPGYHQR